MARKRAKAFVRPPVLDPPSPLPPQIHVEDGKTNVAKLMARRSPKDILEMGLWVEQFLESATGDLVCRTIHLLKGNAVFDSTQPGTNADRVLGKIQAYDTLLNALEGYVKDRRETQAQIAEEHAAETPEEVEG